MKQSPKTKKLKFQKLNLKDFLEFKKVKIEKIKLLLKNRNFKNIKFKALMAPTPLVLDKTLRIYFSGWGVNNISLPYYADFLLESKKIVKKKSNNFEKKPVIKNTLKSFYKKGIILTSIIKRKNIFYCTFAGFSNSERFRYKITTGLAKANNLNERFSIKFNKAFIKNNLNPVIGSPFLFENSQRIFLFTAEGSFNEKTNKPFCNIYVRFLTSLSKTPKANQKKFLCFNLNSNETVHSRPFVFKKKNYFKMFFSVRNKEGIYSNYFGSAISKDCINWKRTANISVKRFKSVCYASLFAFKKKEYVLFNADDYGKEGIYIGEIKI